MVTLKVSDIDAAWLRRTVIVTTFLPVTVWNALVYTAEMICYWAIMVVYGIIRDLLFLAKVW